MGGRASKREAENLVCPLERLKVAPPALSEVGTSFSKSTRVNQRLVSGLQIGRNKNAQLDLIFS